jgi:nitrogen fixation NifU-like protein
MGDSFDEFVSDLQETIIRDARAHYSGTVVDLWLNPRNLGALGHPQGYARIKGPCGDTMEVFLQIAGDRITRAAFRTDGCGPSIAAGSMATQLAAGRTLEEAQAITKQTVLQALGGLPEESEHCALLAANTLAAAIASYQSGEKPDSPAQDASSRGAARTGPPEETPISS